MLVLALAAIAGAGATMVWLADRRRFRRRNEHGQCGACGLAWAEAHCSARYLIQGRLVCANCADTAKRRLICHFGVLTAAAVLATGGIMASKGVVAMVLFPAASTILMVAGAVQVMKVANRNAQRRIALGEFPAVTALHADTGTESGR